MFKTESDAKRLKFGSGWHGQEPIFEFILLSFSKTLKFLPGISDL
jgi:hypothetical protein